MIHKDIIMFNEKFMTKKDIEASTLAVQLLVPKDKLQEYINQGIVRIYELSVKFDISPAAMRYAAFKYGYIKQY